MAHHDPLAGERYSNNNHIQDPSRDDAGPVRDPEHTRLAGWDPLRCDPAFGRARQESDQRTRQLFRCLLCDGSIFPTTGGVNPSLAITSIAIRTADRIRRLAVRGEL